MAIPPGAVANPPSPAPNSAPDGAPTASRAPAATFVFGPEAPEGPEWDLPFHEAPLVWLDLEMTGLDVEADRIVEVAAVRREADGERSLVRLVAPKRPVGASEQVHGISDAELLHAPALHTLRAELSELLEGAILVGHAIPYDLSFLRAAADRGELDAPPHHALDTRLLARKVWHRESYRLQSLCEALSIDPPTHRAEADARATGAVLDVLAKELRVQTPRHLWQAQAAAGERAFRDDVRAVLERALESGAARLAYRVPGRAPFIDELELTSLDATHAVGSLREKAVQMTLRGDRVLWAEHVA